MFLLQCKNFSLNVCNITKVKTQVTLLISQDVNVIIISGSSLTFILTFDIHYNLILKGSTHLNGVF